MYVTCVCEATDRPVTHTCTRSMYLEWRDGRKKVEADSGRTEKSHHNPPPRTSYLPLRSSPPQRQQSNSSPLRARAKWRADCRTRHLTHRQQCQSYDNVQYAYILLAMHSMHITPTEYVYYEYQSSSMHNMHMAYQLLLYESQQQQEQSYMYSTSSISYLQWYVKVLLEYEYNTSQSIYVSCCDLLLICIAMTVVYRL